MTLHDDSCAGRPNPRIVVGSAQLHLLGGFRLIVCGDEYFLRPADQKVLAFLAVRGGAERSFLAGSLWPEVPECRARASLRTALWRLRGLPAPLVAARGGSLALDPSVRTDVAGLVEALDRAGRGEDEALERLLGLADDLLPGWYDDWALFERARLQQAWLQAVESGSARRLRVGDHRAALRAALAVVGRDPWRESAHRLMIQAHRSRGNNQAALEQLRACRALLAEQQIPPSDQLRALGRALAFRAP